MSFLKQSDISSHTADDTIHFLESNISLTESQISDLQAYLLNLTGESIGSLSDVTLTSIVDGELLRWDGTKFINNTLAEADIASATSLSAHSGDATIHFTEASITLTESQISDLQSYLVDITTQNIDALANVNSPTPTDQNVLTWDSTSSKWIDQAPQAVPSAINDLSDVVITTPADNEVLAYDASGNFINQTPAEAGLSDTSHLHTGVYLEPSAIGTTVQAQSTRLTNYANLVTGVNDLVVNGDVLLKMNTAGADPVATNDTSEGYRLFSRWFNTATGDEFVALGVSAGAAVWKKTTSVAGSATLDGLTDTNIGTAFTDEVLAYDQGTSKWIPRSRTELDVLQGVNNLNELSNIITARTNLGVAIGSDVQGYNANTRTLLDNLAATAAPLVTDDSGSGYVVGSAWIDVTNDVSYILVDSSIGAAVWKNISDGSAIARVDDIADVNAYTHAKGTILVSNGVVWSSLVVGADGQVLTANAAAGNGIDWQAGGGGGGSLSGLSDTTISIQSSGARRYWRFFITANGESTLLGISEIQFRESTSGADVTGSGIASASSENSTNYASNAFDDNTSTRWYSDFSPLTFPQWIQYDFGAGNEKTIVEYTIYQNLGDVTRAPKDWILQYSDDALLWFDADVRTGETLLDPGTKTFTVPTAEIDDRASLLYDTTTSTWINEKLQLKDIHDVYNTTPNNGDYLVYDTTNGWKPNTLVVPNPDGYHYAGTITTTPIGTGEDTLVIGDGANANGGTYCTVIGKNSISHTSNFGAIAIGYNVNASAGGNYCMVYGYAANNNVANSLLFAIATITGLHSKNGGNLELIGANSQYVLPSYTVATVPTGTEGGMIWVTDGDAGAKTLAIYDGTAWKRVSLGATISAI